MSESKKAYQQIIKATSLFGSVQLFSIVVSIIRNMLIANFVGPIGMGIAALLNSTLSIITGISGLGLEVSGVKHISESYDQNNLKSVSKQVSIVRKIALITGVIGAILAMIFSKWLSIITFGNDTYTFSFVLISVTLLFKQLTSAENVVLQGLRKLKDLAKGSFYGNLTGLLFSIPLYYFYRIESIVPTILIASLSSLIFAFIFARKNKFETIKLSSSEILSDGKTIIRLGLALAFSGLITLVSSHLIQLYLNFSSGIEMVGFYNAGFTMLNSYVGILFVAMSADYFPRLSAISSDNEKVKETVNRQAFIGVLLITPIIIGFLTFSDVIIKLLFSADFVVISKMVSIGMVGMLFRIVSFSIGYILLAKGESKTFITTSFCFNLVYLLLSIFGYYFYGLFGLGIAFSVHYFIHLVSLYVLTYKKYNFTFSKDVIMVFAICALTCFGSFFILKLDNLMLKVVLSLILLLFSCFYSMIKINEKVDFKTFLKDKNI